MDISAEIATIEKRLAGAAVPMGTFFTEAGIDRSTWTRWRATLNGPRLGNWLSALAAAETLIANATSTPSAVDSPSHAGGPSPDPIPEISETPQPVYGHSDHVVTPTEPEQAGAA